MIKFFRRIRQKLLAQNRFSKYMLYAIGEIFLVMIGILLALQVNNWNENRKKIIIEQDYYCGIYEDLNQDMVNIKSEIVINNSRIENCKKLLLTLQSGKFTSDDIQKLIRLSVIRSTFIFKPIQATFEDLKSSGNLGLIKDRAFKRQLLDYYASLDGYSNVISINSQKTLDLFFDTKKNFLEYGWHYFPDVLQELSPELQLEYKLLLNNYPTKELIEQIRNDAIFYLANNTRKRDIYTLMLEEIKAINDTIKNKCPS